MLNYQKLLMPYKNFKGEHMIDTYQLDADKKEKISAICYMHDARIRQNEIVMNIDDDELYIKLNEFGKMLVEIENLFTQESAYSQ